MIRRLIILLLIVGCAFGDTIVYKLIGIKDKLRNITYLGVKDNQVFYKEDSDIYSIKCAYVVEITNANGDKIDFDCNSNTYIPNTLTELETKKNPVIGGTLIAIGGGFLFSNIDKECNDCETLEDSEDFIEGVNSTAKIGYGFIILGGILVALGI